MGKIHSYLFAPRIEKDGSVLPFSRMDIFWSVILSFSLMADISFAYVALISQRPFNFVERRNLTISLGLGIAILILSGRRRLVLGAALRVMTFRLLFGLLFMDHRAPMALLLAFSGIGAFLLLKDIEKTKFPNL